MAKGSDHKRGTLARIAGIAADHHGTVGRRQLHAADLSRGAIEYPLKRGYLRPIMPGVYAYGKSELSPKGMLTAAVLAAGDQSAVSYRSAALLHGFFAWAGPVEVTRLIGGRSGLRKTRQPELGRVLVHRSRNLPESDRTVVDGIPVTTVERTFIDLAGVLPGAKLEQAIFEARRRQLVDLDRFTAQLSKGTRGRRGIRHLIELIFGTHSRVGLTRSDAEAWMIGLIARHGIRLPLINHRIGRLEVDFVWMPERLAVELDSRTYHDNDPAFTRDRSRDRTLMLGGFRVMRFTFQELRDQPQMVVDQIRAGLAQGPAPSAPQPSR